MIRERLCQLSQLSPRTSRAPRQLRPMGVPQSRDEFKIDCHVESSFIRSSPVHSSQVTATRAARAIGVSVTIIPASISTATLAPSRIDTRWAGFGSGAAARAALDRSQTTLFPECLEDWIDEDNPVRVIEL